MCRQWADVEAFAWDGRLVWVAADCAYDEGDDCYVVTVYALPVKHSASFRADHRVNGQMTPDDRGYSLTVAERLLDRTKIDYLAMVREGTMPPASLEAMESCAQILLDARMLASSPGRFSFGTEGV